MSTASKALLKSLRRETHTEASLNALAGEFHLAESAGLDAKFRQYRVIASLALATREDGSEATSAFVRDVLASEAHYDPEDGTVETSPAVRITDARIRQVKAVFVLAKVFALDLFSADTSDIAQYWADLDAVRRGGNALIKLYDASTIDAARDHVTAETDGNPSTVDVLRAMASDARDLRKRQAEKRERGKREEAERLAEMRRSPETGEDSSPAGDPANDPGNSDGTVTDRETAEQIAADKVAARDAAMADEAGVGPAEVPEVDIPIVRAPDQVGPEGEFLSTLRILARVDLSGMTQEGHAEALDLLTVLQENLLSAGDLVAA